jgi:hypothetical protein
VHAHLAPVADRDPRRLLAAVLERIEPEVGEVRDILSRIEDPEEPAFLAHPLVAQRGWRPVLAQRILTVRGVELGHGHARRRDLRQELSRTPRVRV